MKVTYLWERRVRRLPDVSGHGLDPSGVTSRVYVWTGVPRSQDHSVTVIYCLVVSW